MNPTDSSFELEADEFLLSPWPRGHADVQPCLCLESCLAAPTALARTCNFLMGKLACPLGATFRNMQNCAAEHQNTKLPNLVDYHYFWLGPI